MPTHSAPMIPRQTFFENAACLDPRLSPDGQWISYLSAVDGVMNVWLAPRRDVSEARPLTRQVERPVGITGSRERTPTSSSDATPTATRISTCGVWAWLAVSLAI